MGKVRRLLFSEDLATAAPKHYPDKRAVECAETFHHHERNVRLEYSPVEFAAMLRAMGNAEEKWHDAGSPKVSDSTVYLSLTDLRSHPGVTPRRFEIEESEYPTLDETTIHLHYRNLRLEFSHEEWREFVDGVLQAMDAFVDSRP